MDSRIFCSFYRCILKRILTGSITDGWQLLRPEWTISTELDQSCLSPELSCCPGRRCASKMWPISLQQTHTTPVLQDQFRQAMTVELSGQKHINLQQSYLQNLQSSLITARFCLNVECLFIPFIFYMVCLISDECGLHSYFYAHWFFIP